MRIYLFKRGSIYYFSFDSRGKRKWKSTRCYTKSDAWEFVQSLNNSDNSTLSKLFELYKEASYNLSPKTKELYYRAINNFIIYTNNAYLNSINDQLLNKYLSTLNISDTSRNIMGRAIRTFVNSAISFGLIKYPLIKKIYFRAKSNIIYLTKDEVDKILEVIYPKLKPLVIFTLYTGLRRSEVLELRWEDVDWNRKAVMIRSIKTKRIYTIPLNEIAFEVLNSLRQSFGKIFPYKEEYLTGGFKKAVKRSGVRNEIHFHTLRHTYASWSLIAGARIASISHLLGHSSISTTMKYAHVTNDIVLEDSRAILNFK